MEKQTNDRRSIRTKRLIRDAFTKLMEEKGFEGITVRDLTQKADINRGTFYLHYRDKHDLLERSEAEILQEIENIQRISGKINPIDMLNSDFKEPLPFIMKLFEYIEENADFIKVILGPKGNPGFQVKIKEMMKKNMLQKIVEHKEEGTLVPEEYLISYVSSAYIGVIQQWLDGGLVQSPRDMSLTISRMNILGPFQAAGLFKPE
ncbi:TetR/AcrR family transcriptional regulator [Bacillus gobiensis]|uniref:TetR/AcrR family transcriptional regulator n=1 Tax=Bacillus gobiensis TaxID=1441095 RepID=UPI003D202F9E